MARLTIELVQSYAIDCGYTFEKASKGYLLNGVNIPTLAKIVEIIKNGDLLNGECEALPEIEEITPKAIKKALSYIDQLPKENMKTLYIVRGCPGDGKTTLAKNLAVYNVAADDMPGLYDDDGVYQQHLQKESHEWCKNEIEKKMQWEYSYIAVHNTFTRIFYIKPYIELANKYGYSVHIIHSEAVLTSGGRTTDTHNVPLDILSSMRNSWENWDTLPKLGITAADIAEQIKKAKTFPDAIIFDMDGTIKRTKSGGAFPQTPNDFELTPGFNSLTTLWEKWFQHHIDDIDLYIASNQRGLSGGQKTEDFLKLEWFLLDGYLRQNCDIHLEKTFFLIKDYAIEANNDWEYIRGNFAKPSPTVFELIHKDSNRHNYWIIGDAHTDDRSEDWQFAQNCQKAYPKLNIAYVPIELAAYIYQLHHA